jgi:competence protein ComEA
MQAGRLFNRWSVLVVVLLVVIVAGGVIIGRNYHPGQPVEIVIFPTPTPEGEVYVGGAVNNPGIYPFYAGDDIEDILRAAGGLTADADISQIELSIPGKGEVAALQKININTADVWLLAALPGIGDVRAEAIVAYRNENGSFRDINELLNVAGIGAVTLDKIRDLITVGN